MITVSMNQIGFSVVVEKSNRSLLADILESMLNEGCQAVELNFVDNNLALETDAVATLKKFAYCSIHLPAVYNESALPGYVELAEMIGAKTLTLHPAKDLPLDKLSQDIKNLIAVENMDWRKSYGKTVSDLREIFEQLPSSRWVFDLNHVYSIDSSMKLAKSLYGEFADRLAHYHISGFGGDELPHTKLFETHQDEIIHSVFDNKPIIIESLGSADINVFQKELSYVRGKLISA